MNGSESLKCKQYPTLHKIWNHINKMFFLTSTCQQICSIFKNYWDFIPSPTYMLLYVIIFCCILPCCITSLLYGFLYYVACFLFAQACLIWFDHIVLHHVLINALYLNLIKCKNLQKSQHLVFVFVSAEPSHLAPVHSLVQYYSTLVGFGEHPLQSCWILCAHSKYPHPIWVPNTQGGSYVSHCIKYGWSNSIWALRLFD